MSLGRLFGGGASFKTMQELIDAYENCAKNCKNKKTNNNNNNNTINNNDKNDNNCKEEEEEEEGVPYELQREQMLLAFALENRAPIDRAAVYGDGFDCQFPDAPDDDDDDDDDGSDENCVVGNGGLGLKNDVVDDRLPSSKRLTFRIWQVFDSYHPTCWYFWLIANIGMTKICHWQCNCGATRV
jgi:hypothetical protein